MNTITGKLYEIFQKYEQKLPVFISSFMKQLSISSGIWEI